MFESYTAIPNSHFGKGTCGTVTQVWHMLTGCCLVVKLSNEDDSSIGSELRVDKSLKRPVEAVVCMPFLPCLETCVKGLLHWFMFQPIDGGSLRNHFTHIRALDEESLLALVV